MTAGLGAAIAAGQGVASASPDESPGTDSGAASSRGPERSQDDADDATTRPDSTTSPDEGSQNSADDEQADADADIAGTRSSDDDVPFDDGRSNGGDEPSGVAAPTSAANAVDLMPTAPIETLPVKMETTEFPVDVMTEGDATQLPPDNPGPREPLPAPVESLGLAVRDLQNRREVENLVAIPTSQAAPQPTQLTFDATPSLTQAPVSMVVTAAPAPPNWFATAINGAFVFARNVTNAVVETTRRVVDGVVRVTVAVVDGVARLLFGDYDTIPVQTPTDTAGHWERLRTVTGGLLNDGFHIDKVRSAYDGVERLTVYIGGTTFGLNQPVFQNSVGWSGQAQYWQVDQIKRAQGDNPDIEILIFGYSQGGMDAQNLAAHAEEKGLNVAMVLTFGSPVVQDPPDDPYAWIFHIQAHKDPVPDWGHLGKRATARAAGIVFEPTTNTGDKFWADWNGLGEVHGDPATYREAAEKFDDWLSDSNMDYWEGQYLRYY